MSEKPRASKKNGTPGRRSSRSRSKAAVQARIRRRYERLEGFDREFVCDSHDCVVGIDEAGRGALAGPVVAAAVSLRADSGLLGVNDSKALPEDERERLFDVVVKAADSVGISFSQPVVIDRYNILNATLMAMAKAFGNLRLQPSITLLDGRDQVELPGRVVTVIGGDHKSLAIAAASIVAKVARDRVMRRLHNVYPQYNFIHNKGYGTKDHLDAIEKHGVGPHHRMSYRVNTVEKVPTLF